MFEIIWNNKNAFTYGSKIKYVDNKVVFENELMPSGTSIISWESNREYQANRIGGIELPLLKQERHYKLNFEIDASPLDTYFIKIVFKNRMGKTIGYKDIKLSGEEFEYPLLAFSYSIYLINKGVVKLQFNNMYINENDI